MTNINGNYGIGYNEILIGTASDDIFDGKGGGDQMNGFAGNDTALFFDSKNYFSVMTLAGITHVRALAGGDRQYYSSSYPYDAVLTNVETVQFVDSIISIAPSSNKNLITGIYSVGYLEEIQGTNSDDVIDPYGSHANLISISPPLRLDGGDRVDGGQGDDTVIIFDYSSNFVMNSLSGVTHLSALSSADPIYFSAQYYYDTILINVEHIQFFDTTISISVTPSNKYFVIAPKSITYSDNIIGSSLDDVIDTTGGNDHVNGGAGIDTVVFFDSKNYFSVMTLAGITHVRSFDGTKPQYYSSSYPYDAVLTNVETVQFVDSIISIAPSSTTSFIFGSVGVSSSDTLNGTTGNDTFDSRGGSDRIDGGAGTDTAAIFDSKNYFSVMTLAGITHVRALAGGDRQYYSSSYPFGL